MVLDVADVMVPTHCTVAVMLADASTPVGV